MTEWVEVGNAQRHGHGDTGGIAGWFCGDLLGCEGGTDFLDEWFEFGWKADRSSVLIGHDPIDSGVGDHAASAAEESRAASRHHVAEADKGRGARHRLIGARRLIDK